MKEFSYNEEIKIMGATFSNIYEIIYCAVNHVAKDGVYVGEDSQGYPCFDSEDSASENRSYWNFVFEYSEEQLENKLKQLKAMPVVGDNYYKMDSTLSPMVYWGGDTNCKVKLNDEQYRPFSKVDIKDIGKLDMIIAFDTTGSMAAYIDAVRKEVADLVPRLFKENEDLRLGIVAFGDYCDMNNANDYGNAYQSVSLTNNENELIKFIKESKDTSGGDGDEFYELVIKKIIEETPWRENSTRAILLISDADPHPLGYTYNDYVVGNQIDWRKEAEKAARLNIKIDTVTIQDRPWYKELSQITKGISVPFETGEKTARLVEAATMARGSIRSRQRFDALEYACDDMEMQQVFNCYQAERHSFESDIDKD